MTRIRFSSFAAAGATLLLLSAGTASAQGTMTPPQPPPLPTQPPAQPAPAQPTPTQPPPVAAATPAEGPAKPAEQPAEGEGPPARTGFQMAIRGGAAIPFGEIAKNQKLNDVFGPQAAFSLDIGGKVIPNLFIGGYLGLNIGGAGGKAGDVCSSNNLTCTSATIRLGVEAQYHILPDGKINPWVGYGIGIESSGLGQSKNGQTVTVTATGWEFAHLMAGADFRISKTFGIGPVVDFSIAQYSRTATSGGLGDSSSDIKDKTLHEWLTIGARLVLFP